MTEAIGDNENEIQRGDARELASEEGKGIGGASGLDGLEASVPALLLLLLAVRVETCLLLRHEARRLGTHEARLHRHPGRHLLLHREACGVEQ